MTSICQKCALRLRKVAQTDARHISKRAFNTSTTKQRGNLPTFHESSNAELDDILATFRIKHLIPASLHKQERKLIFGDKHRQQLEDNPRSTLIGDEEIQLQWHDRKHEIPNRGKLLTRAVNLITDGESKDWENLPKLLQALKEGIKKPLNDAQLEKVIRRATQSDKFGVIIKCLQQAHRTGLTLKNDAVLRSVLVGLRQLASTKQWTKGATGRALRDSNVIAQLLESEEHGTGRRLVENDPRTQPEVLGLYLELAAVYAFKYTDSQDVEGLVKSFAGRLTSQLEQRGTEPRSLQLEAKSRQWSMLTAIPIWHGLSVAQAILGKDMPNQAVARQAIVSYRSALEKLAVDLEARGSNVSYYNQEALEAWKACREA